MGVQSIDIGYEQLRLFNPGDYRTPQDGALAWAIATEGLDDCYPGDGDHGWFMEFVERTDTGFVGHYKDAVGYPGIMSSGEEEVEED